jgi:hypothetical protein
LILQKRDATLEATSLIGRCRDVADQRFDLEIAAGALLTEVLQCNPHLDVDEKALMMRDWPNVAVKQPLVLDRSPHSKYYGESSPDGSDGSDDEFEERREPGHEHTPSDVGLPKPDPLKKMSAEAAGTRYELQYAPNMAPKSPRERGVHVFGPFGVAVTVLGTGEKLDPKLYVGDLTAEAAIQPVLLNTLKSLLAAAHALVELAETLQPDAMNIVDVTNRDWAYNEEGHVAGLPFGKGRPWPRDETILFSRATTSRGIRKCEPGCCAPAACSCRIGTLAHAAALFLITDTHCGGARFSSEVPGGSALAEPAKVLAKLLGCVNLVPALAIGNVHEPMVRCLLYAVKDEPLPTTGRIRTELSAAELAYVKTLAPINIAFLPASADRDQPGCKKIVITPGPESIYVLDGYWGNCAGVHAVETDSGLLLAPHRDASHRGRRLPNITSVVTLYAVCENEGLPPQFVRIAVIVWIYS